MLSLRERDVDDTAQETPTPTSDSGGQAEFKASTPVNFLKDQERDKSRAAIAFHLLLPLDVFSDTVTDPGRIA